MPRRLRVLIVTNLFPSNVDPGFAPFNRQQFAALGQLADVEVFAVVPRLAYRPSGAQGELQLLERESVPKNWT